MLWFSQLTKEKKSLDDKLQEATQQLADEEEKAKGLAKQKAKQDALIADLEERLRNSEKVNLILDSPRNTADCLAFLKCTGLDKILWLFELVMCSAVIWLSELNVRLAKTWKKSAASWRQSWLKSTINLKKPSKW